MLGGVGALLLGAAVACGVGRAKEAALPEPTPEAVRAYLAAHDYRTWPVWPGHRFAPSGRHGPHTALLTIYLNPVALDAVRTGVPVMPEGSFIVKESYSADRALVRVSVMYKAEGYAPEWHDWFWMELGPDLSVAEAGNLAKCRECHRAARANDYVMTGPIHDAREPPPFASDPPQAP